MKRLYTLIFFMGSFLSAFSILTIDCAVGGECTTPDAGRECVTDLDCNPGHLCQESGLCTKAPVTTFEDCAKVRPLLQADRFFDRSRFSVFLIVSGRHTEEIWKTQVANLVADINRGNCTDYYFRLVIPSKDADGGARLVELSGVGKTVISKKDGALGSIVLDTLYSLPATPEGSPGLLKAGLWALQQISTGVLDEQSSGVLIYILTDGDDCSSNLPTPDCGQWQDLIDVNTLAQGYQDAATAIRASSPQYRWGTMIPSAMMTIAVTPGAYGCTLDNGTGFPKAPRVANFMQALAVGTVMTTQEVSWCETHWGGHMTTPECDGEVANPVGFSFPLMPVSLDLVTVRSNGVLVAPSKIWYLWGHNGKGEDHVFPTTEDIWGGFDKYMKQSLVITNIDGLDHGGMAWDDFINVLYCPMYHTSNPFSNSSQLGTNLY